MSRAGQCFQKGQSASDDRIDGDVKADATRDPVTQAVRRAMPEWATSQPRRTGAAPARWLRSTFTLRSRARNHRTGKAHATPASVRSVRQQQHLPAEQVRTGQVLPLIPFPRVRGQ